MSAPNEKESYDVYGRHSEPCGRIDLSSLLFDCPNCFIEAEKTVRARKLNFEKFRLESFIGWPVPWIDANTLAKIGFYYTGEGDKVMCNFCKIGLRNWEAEDCPIGEHRKHSPGCRMEKDKSNIPMKEKDCNDLCGSYLVILKK